MLKCEDIVDSIHEGYAWGRACYIVDNFSRSGVYILLTGLCQFDLASNVGTLRLHRRRPAFRRHLYIGAIRHVLVMSFQGVLARELIMAAATLPRRRLVCEDALVPLQVTQCFTHLLAAGDSAWETHRASAGN
jgi:hypothetical protein